MSPPPVRERPRTPIPKDRLLELAVSAAIVLVLLIAIVLGIT
jgi:hypothetical protein